MSTRKPAESKYLNSWLSAYTKQFSNFRDVAVSMISLNYGSDAGFIRQVLPISWFLNEVLLWLLRIVLTRL
jgi:hypothetical protein